METEPHPNDFEHSDADPRLIAALAAGIAVFLASSPYLLGAMYPSASQMAGIERDLPRPPQPQLEVTPKARLEAQRQHDDALLQTYGWTDRERSITRIPIERAMQLLAERGLAGWPSAAAQSSR